MKLKVGDKLKEIREDRKLTQEEFAIVLGISSSVYSRLERNETTPDISQLMRFSDTLKVPIQDFLPDTITFQTHNDHGNIGCVLGTVHYYNSKDDTIKEIENENRILRERIVHLNEKYQLLEDQNKLLQQLLLNRE